MRSLSRFGAVSLGITLICSCGAARGQQAGAHPAGAGNDASGHPSAHAISLPVTVRDKKGALVTNLQSSDVTVTDEGKAQTVSSLKIDRDAPLRVGLLVETSHGISGGLEAERKAADTFIDALLPANQSENRNQAFLIHFDREVELLQDFTNSASKLHEQLADMGQTRATQDNTQGPETTGDDRERPRGNGHNDAQLYDAIYLACDELMAGKSGRKVLIVFADGIDRGSKDRLTEAIDAADKAGVSIYTVFFKGEQERNAANNFPANRRGGGWPGGGGGGYPGGGGGYPGGSPGGRRGGGPASTENGVDGRKIMQQIATRTGGHAYDARRREDLDPIYKLIHEELNGQYVLTYTPDKLEADGTFHKVLIEAKNKDYSVVTREGYFAPGGDK